MYKNILFDLDDTILDFAKSERKALQKIFESFDIPFVDEHIEKYKQINHNLWVQFESGEVAREQIFERRFPDFLAHYGHEITGTSVDYEYRLHLMNGHDVLDGAEELLQSLQDTHRLYVVTNGLKEMQCKRLKDSGLERYFTKIFISEDVGYKKPEVQFFSHVFNEIEDFKKEETIIVGDMLHADILGGYNAGIDTAWVNNKQFPIYVEVNPTYEIQHIQELYDILKIQRVR